MGAVTTNEDLGTRIARRRGPGGSRDACFCPSVRCQPRVQKETGGRMGDVRILAPGIRTRAKGNQRRRFTAAALEKNLREVEGRKQVCASRILNSFLREWKELSGAAALRPHQPPRQRYRGGEERTRAVPWTDNLKSVQKPALRSVHLRMRNPGLQLQHPFRRGRVDVSAPLTAS